MRRIGVVAALAWLAACGPAPPPDTRGADERVIREFEAAWSKATETKDLETVLEFFATDAVLLAPNRPPLNGWQEIGGALLTIFKDPNFWLTFQMRRVESARSGDVAYTYGAYSMTFSGPKKERLADSGKYVTIWKKQFDGRWKAVFNMYSSDLAAPRPAEP